MSLLNDVLKSVLANNTPAVQGQAQAQPDVLITAAMAMLDKAGGIQGIIEKFQSSGLGDTVASWVGTGQNQPVTAEQISQALGQENVQIVVKEANIPAEQSGSILSALLPVLIDQLTPDGQVPQQSQMMNLGKTILSSLLSGKTTA
jgi:uncharacterized protein YidB (DUF937 family)